MNEHEQVRMFVAALMLHAIVRQEVSFGMGLMNPDSLADSAVVLTDSLMKRLAAAPQ